MRAKTLVTLAVCALLVFGFAIKASAQIGVTHLVSSTPVDVIQTGVTEVLGEVRLVMDNTLHGGVAETTIAGNINVLYQDVPLTNLGCTYTTPCIIPFVSPGLLQSSGGITITYSGGYIPGDLITAQAINTPSGGLVTIAIAGGLTIAQGDTLTINGVRARITGKPVGADVTASIQSQPSNADSFLNVSQVRVARTNIGLLVTVESTTSALCLPPESPIIKLTEGFPGAFVQYVTVAGAYPTRPRNKYGATNNTQIKVQVVNVPKAVTITFPTTVESNDSTLLWSATLVKIGDEVVSEGPTTDTVVVMYEFTTTDQGTADQGTQEFDIALSSLEYDTTSGIGEAQTQATLNPKDKAVSTDAPRFVEKWTNDPLDNLFTVQKCRTYILLPFLTNAAGSTFDSGVAIANTSLATGVPGLADASAPQHGSVTIYGFPQFTSGGTTPTPISAVMATDLEAGNTVAASLSGITGLAGFQGYAIVVCEFQYGHAFAYMSANYGQPVPVVAEGYLGLIIPDPVFTTNALRHASPAAIPDSGENLGN